MGKAFLLITTLFSFSNSFAQEPAKLEPSREALRVDQLSSDELEIYRHGKIESGEWVAGGLLGTLVGFGTGHLVYDRYLAKGWIFTVGEAAGLAIAIGGINKYNSSCLGYSSNYCQKETSQLLMGALIITGFHIWEVVDVWMYPSTHNHKYDSIRERMTGTGFSISPYVSNQIDGGYGLQLGFRF